MVKRILSLLEREIRGLHEAAYLLAVFAFLSQVLALFRDRTFAHLFGAGPQLDAYFAAFRIPDLIFAFLTLFVSSFALIPLLARKPDSERGSFLGAVLFMFGSTAIVVCGILFIVAPYLIPYLVPGFSASATADTLLLARIMLIQPVLLGLSSILASVVQTSRRFVLFAIAPIFYNLGIIGGAFFLYPVLGIAGLGWGVVIGAWLHFFIQALPLFTGGIYLQHLRVVRRGLWVTLQEVVVPSMPRAAALMSNQALFIAFAAIGSVVSVGAVSTMSFAFNLGSVPLTIIGVSYAAVLFPALAALAVRNDNEGFVNELWTSVRHVAFWLLPATAFIIVLRAHIVRIVLGSGAFSWDDTRLTAAIVALVVVSLLAQALILIFSRAFYARSKTALPIVLNVGGALVAGLAAYGGVMVATAHPGIRYFVEALFRVGDVPGTTILLVPMAYSVVMLVVGVLFALAAARVLGYQRGVLASLGVSFSASIIGAVGAYGALQVFGPLLPTNTFLGILLQTVAAGLYGALVWVAVLWFMKSRELADVIVVLRSRYIRTPYGSETHS